MITAATLAAGVVGQPVRHSLSPRLHNAWLQAAGVDGVYLALGPREGAFPSLIAGLRGGEVLRGVNVTIPFKEMALAAADEASPLAKAAGAANVLLFHDDGRIEARNTDGAGLLKAFAVQAPRTDLTAGPVAIFGAGGAARGAAAALLEAGAPELRIVNRTLARAEALAAQLGPRVRAFDDGHAAKACAEAVAVINATSLGLGGGQGPPVPWAALPAGAAALDMVYKPLETHFLKSAAAHGLTPVDGLDMLIGQAAPSFEAFFGAPPPASVDARALLLAELEK